jgi:hypothetical protein
LSNVADRVYKLTNSTQEKCYLKLGFVNDQRQPLFPKRFSRKKCLSCLKTKRANIYIRKIQELGKTMERALDKRMCFIGKRNERVRKMSHGEQP